jgi:hypothetical protein
MKAIENAIKVLQGCLEHPGADDAIAGLQAMLAQEPVAYLICGGRWGDELEEWEIDPVQSECDKINEAAYQKGKKLKVPLFAGHTAQREPLTIEKIASMDYRGTLDEHIRAVRMAEAAHGIKKGCA